MSFDCLDFISDLQWADIPNASKRTLLRSVLDTVGVASVGRQTDMGRITADYARQHWAAGPQGPKARMMFDGGIVAPAGAAFAGAFAIDSIDAHDGHSPVKGHAGSGVFPALVAIAQTMEMTGEDFLTAMAVGYEVSYRAGLSQHATCADYHTSGAWTAVGVAAMGARLLGLTPEQTRHAMGIAEYHGPRSQMMRCIDHPSMVRDGVGWGAPTGVTAVYMAQAGFTGAPAITVEQNDVAQFWQGLGDVWEIDRTHYKRYPVCRWAHPAIDAVADMMTDHNLDSSQIQAVQINTFHNATRLAGQSPETTDEIAYGIAFPTAIMMVRGKIGLTELSAAVLEDPEIRRISMATTMHETEVYNAKADLGERWADVTLNLFNGARIKSKAYQPKGDPDLPLSDKEISEKFHGFAGSVVGKKRATTIETCVADLAQLPDIGPFLDLICEP